MERWRDNVCLYKVFATRVYLVKNRIHQSLPTLRDDVLVPVSL